MMELFLGFLTGVLFTGGLNLLWKMQVIRNQFLVYHDQVYDVTATGRNPFGLKIDEESE